MSIQVIREGGGIAQECPKCKNASVFSDYKYEFTWSWKEKFHKLKSATHTCDICDFTLTNNNYCI